MGPILDFIFDFIINGLCEAVNLALEYFVFELNQNSFTPSLQAFYDRFGGITSAEAFISFFRYLGFSVVALIFIGQLLMFFAGHMIEIKENIFQISGRLILALILVYVSIYSVNGSLSGFAILLQEWGVNLSNGTSSFIDNICSNIGGSFGANVLEDIKDIGRDFFEGRNLTGLSANLATIIQIILILVILISFIKLCVELMSRYLYFSVMLLAAPSFMAFFASGSSMPIVFTYAKTLLTQMVILILTKSWLTIFTSVFTNNYDLVGLLLMVGWLRMGTTLERYLKEMGLSVSTSGLALFDTIAGTAMSGVMMLANAGRMKQSIGRAVTTLGANTGNPALMQTGSVLSGFNKMTDGQMLQKAATSLNPNASVTPQMKSLALQMASSQAGMKDLARSMSSMPRPQQDQLMNHVVGSMYGDVMKERGIQFSNDSARISMNGGLTGSGTVNGHGVNFSIDEKPGGIPLHGTTVGGASLDGLNMHVQNADPLPTHIDGDISGVSACTVASTLSGHDLEGSLMQGGIDPSSIASFDYNGSSNLYDMTDSYGQILGHADMDNGNIYYGVQATNDINQQYAYMNELKSALVSPDGMWRDLGYSNLDTSSMRYNIDPKDNKTFNISFEYTDMSGRKCEARFTPCSSFVDTDKRPVYIGNKLTGSGKFTQRVKPDSNKK